jgi:predicted dehydrogenase
MHKIAPEPIAAEFEDVYVAQCRHFCAVIQGSEQPRITALDATKTLRATLAVFEAADKGTEIRL